MRRGIKFLAVVLLCACLCGCYSSPAIVVENSPSSVPNGEVAVHVAGEVHLPGLYKLPAGSRVADALRVAGGTTSAADVDALNLAALLADGQKITVPAKKSGSESASGSTPLSSIPSSPEGGKININTASKEILETLPGIGEILAQRIIDLREKRGGFKRVEEIQDVSGIGQKKFEAIKDLITVDH